MDLGRGPSVSDLNIKKLGLIPDPRDRTKDLHVWIKETDQLSYRLDVKTIGRRTLNQDADEVVPDRTEPERWPTSGNQRRAMGWEARPVQKLGDAQTWTEKRLEDTNWWIKERVWNRSSRRWCRDWSIRWRRRRAEKMRTTDFETGAATALVAADHGRALA
jgi:hypothetical protein